MTKTLEILYDDLHAAFIDDFMQPEIVRGNFCKFYTMPSGDTVIIPTKDYDPFLCGYDYTEYKNVIGVRLSAPGFLDCTDWDIFDSEEEAVRYLIDNFSSYGPS